MGRWFAGETGGDGGAGVEGGGVGDGAGGGSLLLVLEMVRWRWMPTGMVLSRVRSGRVMFISDQGRTLQTRPHVHIESRWQHQTTRFRLACSAGSTPVEFRPSWAGH